jgi:hypothetical protein
MAFRNASGFMVKTLIVIFLCYCIITTVRTWVGEPCQLPHNGWVLLWGGLALSIARRWAGRLGRPPWDWALEIILIALHIITGAGIAREGSSTSLP